MKQFNQIMKWLKVIKENAEKIEKLSEADATKFRLELAKARDKISGSNKGWLAIKNTKNQELRPLVLAYFNFNMARSRALTQPPKSVTPPQPPSAKQKKINKWNNAIDAWDALEDDEQRAEFLAHIIEPAK